MDYELSQHADNVVATRGIQAAWIERVVAAPDRIERDPMDTELEHRLGRIPEHGDRVLRVILKPSVTPMRIITAYFDRTMKDKL